MQFYAVCSSVELTELFTFLFHIIVSAYFCQCLYNWFQNLLKFNVMFWQAKAMWSMYMCGSTDLACFLPLSISASLPSTSYNKYNQCIINNHFSLHISTQKNHSKCLGYLGRRLWIPVDVRRMWSACEDGVQCVFITHIFGTPSNTMMHFFMTFSVKVLSYE